MQNRVLEVPIPGLDKVSQAIEAQDKANIVIQRGTIEASDRKVRDLLIEALDNVDAYAESLQDPSETTRIKNGLLRSGVNGSDVMGIRSFEDVKRMVMSLTDIRLVISASDDNAIDVYEGMLPERVKAYTAYASMTEIGLVYGDPALSTIQVKLGRWDNEVYLCTTQKIKTSILTVHIRKDGSGVDQLAQWFAGKDVKTRVIRSAGDVVVRCGIDIKTLEEQRVIQDSKKAARAHTWGRNAGNASRPTR